MPFMILVATIAIRLNAHRALPIRAHGALPQQDRQIGDLGNNSLTCLVVVQSSEIDDGQPDLPVAATPSCPVTASAIT
jgi:hypothetical protein